MTSKYREAFDNLPPYKRIYDHDLNLNHFLARNYTAIRQALRIAERLESGEVSFEMLKASVDDESKCKEI